jgi:phage shock protein A
MMMKKIAKKEPKYVTMPVFEKAMDFMAKSFAKVFEKLERHDKAFELVLKEMRDYSQEAREHRMMMSDLNHSDISQERRIEGLEIRVEKLERKAR